MPLASAYSVEDRVRRHTTIATNERLDARARNNILSLAETPPQELARRIERLGKDWDIERWLETGAAVMIFGGTALGVLRHRRWFTLPLFVSGFLFQHAVDGWCPPVPALRRLGVRTRREIDRELYALKMLRGDFDLVPATPEERLERALRVFDRSGQAPASARG